MNWVTNLAYKGLSANWHLGRLRTKAAKMGVSVFTYHELGPDDDSVDAWQIVRVSDFKRQLDYLQEYYDIVSIDEALANVSKLGGGKPLAVLTFDDGHKGCLDYLAPIMRESDIPVTLYLATEHIASQHNYWFDRIVNRVQSMECIELDLSKFSLGHHKFNETRGSKNWARIQQLLVRIKSLSSDTCNAIADEIEKQTTNPNVIALRPLSVTDVESLAKTPRLTIGAHTHGHEVLTHLSPTDVKDSIQTSVDLIDKWTGSRPNHFAYPGGFWNEKTTELIAEMGFSSAVTTVSGLWTPDHSIFRIPRISIGRYDGFEKFKFNILRDRNLLAESPLRLFI